MANKKKKNRPSPNKPKPPPPNPPTPASSSKPPAALQPAASAPLTPIVSSTPKASDASTTSTPPTVASSSLPLNPDYVERSLPGYLGVTLRGTIMGSADVIPGVSGGTMALILGIYQELISSIKAFDLTALKLLFAGRFRDLSRHLNLPFLFFLLAGIATAIVSLAKVVPRLLETHPALIHGFFFGLILASVVVVWREIEKHDALTLFCGFLGALGAYLLVGLIPVQTPDALWFIFACGFVAIIAMILPGISGAFVLFLLGKYVYVLDALQKVVSTRKFDENLAIVIVFCFGCASGLLAFARLLNWLLKNYHAVTLALLTGFMVGSLRRIWPFQTYHYEMIRGKKLVSSYTNIWPSSLDSNALYAIGLVVFGFVLVLVLDKIAQKRAAVAH